MGKTRKSILGPHDSSLVVLTRRIAAVALLGASASLMADFLLLDREHLHVVLPYADIPGFWTVFGLFWCGMLILGSKWVGHLFLMRLQDPYSHLRPPGADHSGDGR
jgi:hypothetical protein